MIVFGVVIVASIGVAFAGVAVDMKEVSFVAIVVLAVTCGIVLSLSATSKH
jgi:hypothetical protein